MAQHQAKTDLVIAYRVYPGVSKVPFVHAGSKIALVEAGIRSMKEGLEGLKAHIHVLYDSCPPVYEECIEGILGGEHRLTAHHLEKAGNARTYTMQLDLLGGQEESTAVYLAEDDYIYTSGCFSEMVEFLHSSDEHHFVTAYDHPDYYEHPLHDYTSLVKVGTKRHWRTVSSTCLTFMAKKEALRRAKSILATFGRANYDVSMWMAMTKYQVGLGSMLRYGIGGDRFQKIVMAKTWFYGWRQILFGDTYKLWSPMPSLATHAESTGIAPLLDWDAIAAQNAPRA